MKRWIHAGSVIKQEYTLGNWGGVDRSSDEYDNYDSLDYLVSVVEQLANDTDTNLVVNEKHTKDNRFGVEIKIGSGFEIETRAGYVIRSRKLSPRYNCIFDVISPSEIPSEYGYISLKGICCPYIPNRICEVYEAKSGLPNLEVSVLTLSDPTSDEKFHFRTSSRTLEISVEQLKQDFPSILDESLAVISSLADSDIQKDIDRKVEKLAEAERKRKVKEASKKDKNLSKPIDSKNILDVVKEYKKKQGWNKIVIKGDILKSSNGEGDVMYYSISDIVNACNAQDITIGQALDDPAEAIYITDYLDIAGPSNRGTSPTKADLKMQYGF